MAYLWGVPARVTVMTLVTILCGGFLGAGVHLPFAGWLPPYFEIITIPISI